MDRLILERNLIIKHFYGEATSTLIFIILVLRIKKYQNTFSDLNREPQLSNPKHSHLNRYEMSGLTFFGGVQRATERY